MARLDEIFDLQMGKTPSRSNADYWTDGQYDWVSIADLGTYKKYVEDTKEKISASAVQESGIKSVPANTVIMSFKLSLGKTAITQEPVYTNEAIMAFIPTGKYTVLPDYFYYLLSAKDWTKGTNRAVMGATLNKATLGAVSVTVPPLNEQRKIVMILDKVSDLLAKHHQQLDKLDELVKSRFIEMFGDINVNDKGWTIQPLGELCTIVRGGSPRPIEKFLGGDVPWIKIGDATDGESIYLHSTKEHIIREGVSKSRMVKAGSLIFANCGVSLGFARIITFDGCIHDGWLAMEDIDARLDKVFLLQALNQMTEHFRKIAPAGTQPNLNTAIMKAYKQIIPPMKLQKDFISFVEQTDKSKYRQEKCIRFFQCLEKNIRQEWL